MTKYAEIEYDNGSKSIISYEDESELDGLVVTNKDNEDVSDIRQFNLYNEIHPGETIRENAGEASLLGKDEIGGIVDRCADRQGVVDIFVLIQELRRAISPVDDKGNYKLQPVGVKEVGGS